MILFLIDILCWNLTSFKTFFIILNFIHFKKSYIYLYIVIFFEFLIFKSHYRFLILILIMLIVNNKLLKKYFNQKNIIEYLSLNVINYFIFIILGSMLNNNFSMSNIFLYATSNLLLNFFIWIIYFYKVIE